MSSPVWHFPIHNQFKTDYRISIGPRWFHKGMKKQQYGVPKMSFLKLLIQGFLVTCKRKLSKLSQVKRGWLEVHRKISWIPNTNIEMVQVETNTLSRHLSLGLYDFYFLGTSRLWLISEDQISQFICMYTAKKWLPIWSLPDLTALVSSMELLIQYLGLWVQIIKQKNLIGLGVLSWSPNHGWGIQGLMQIWLPLPGSVGRADSLRRECGWGWNN